MVKMRWMIPYSERRYEYQNVKAVKSSMSGYRIEIGASAVPAFAK